jgi:hypothetical protein
MVGISEVAGGRAADHHFEGHQLPVKALNLYLAGILQFLPAQPLL